MEEEEAAKRIEENRASRWQHETNLDILSLVPGFLPRLDFINIITVCCGWRDTPISAATSPPSPKLTFGASSMTSRSRADTGFVKNRAKWSRARQKRV
ncbi:hypothetical protein AXF42_Ash017431 [Apostasia shenzhenica]|uniref:F-box domain-containing protein n=1 Tax=Apostasia shenzhenica TaxID=1088818 RepID=A0A2H9ZZ32_9ASPA|nr:hypothetical protein AXF42_Ash017431 [Apostasia shenzhenica]